MESHHCTYYFRPSSAAESRTGDCNLKIRFNKSKSLKKKKKIILVSQKNCVMMRFLAITFFEKTNKGEYSIMHNCEPTVEVSKNCCVSASHEEYLYK